MASAITSLRGGLLRARSFFKLSGPSLLSSILSAFIQMSSLVPGYELMPCLQEKSHHGHVPKRLQVAAKITTTTEGFLQLAARLTSPFALQTSRLLLSLRAPAAKRMPLITHPLGESNHNLIYGVVPAHGTKTPRRSWRYQAGGPSVWLGIRLTRPCEFSEKGAGFRKGKKVSRVTISFFPRLCLHPLPAIDRSTIFDLL